MGFDINVMMSLMMCPAIGKPYYYKISDTKVQTQVHGVPDIVVPAHLRSYLVGRGHIFHAYTSHFNYEDRFNVDVHEFLDHFPMWEDVQESDYYVHDDPYWTEADHKAFYELIQWCAKQYVEFRVSWSY